MRKFVRRVHDLRIGVRLAAVFALCGLVWSGAFALDMKAQHDAGAVADQVRLAEQGQQIGDDLLIAINDITGWQGLYIADAAAYGLDKDFWDNDYNVQGFAKSQQGIADMFDTMDTSMLTAEEAAVIAKAEKHFDQFFRQDAKLRAALAERGLAAMPEVMDSVNGGPAGAAWSATYDSYDSFHKLIDARVKTLRRQQEADLAAGQRLVAIALGIAVLVAVVMLLLVTRSVVRPVRQMAAQLREVAAGRLETRAALDRGDEVGQMSAALDEALDAITGTLRQMGANAEALSTASAELSAVSSQMTGSAFDAATRADQVASAADQVSTTCRPSPPAPSRCRRPSARSRTAPPTPRASRAGRWPRPRRRPPPSPSSASPARRSATSSR